MSIASEYAMKMKELREMQKPRYSIEKKPTGGQNGGICVSEEGYLETNGFICTPEDALKFADWIYKTFGENKK